MSRARPGHLDIWCIDLDLPAEAVACCERILDPEERARAGRFLRPRDRRRYSVSHAALRHLLSRYTGLGARDLRFEAGPQGKPDLSPETGACLAFNLSRSGEMALVGITAATRLGVDIEQLRVVDDSAAIARSFFSPSERCGLGSVPPDRADVAFLTCWTRKEAFVKALGTGLSFPLDRFDVSLGREDARILGVDGDAQAGRRWDLIHLEPAEGYIGAAAVEGRATTHLIHRLDLDWTRTLR